MNFKKTATRRQVLKAGAIGAGAILIPEFFTGTKEAQAQSSFNLLVQNLSGFRETFIIFTEDSGVSGGTRYWPIVMMAQQIDLGSQVRYSWAASYSYFYAQTGAVTVGELVTPSGTAQANLSTNNKVMLTQSGGGYQFVDQIGGTTDSFTIECDGNIPFSELAVGIAVSGHPAVGTQADPNDIANFDTAFRYYIGVGQFQQGEIISPLSLVGTALIPFSNNASNVIATFDPNHEWSFETA